MIILKARNVDRLSKALSDGYKHCNKVSLMAPDESVQVIHALTKLQIDEASVLDQIVRGLSDADRYQMMTSPATKVDITHQPTEVTLETMKRRHCSEFEVHCANQHITNLNPIIVSLDFRDGDQCHWFEANDIYSGSIQCSRERLATEMQSSGYILPLEFKAFLKGKTDHLPSDGVFKFTEIDALNFNRPHHGFSRVTLDALETSQLLSELLNKNAKYEGSYQFGSQVINDKGKPGQWDGFAIAMIGREEAEKTSMKKPVTVSIKNQNADVFTSFNERCTNSAIEITFDLDSKNHRGYFKVNNEIKDADTLEKWKTGSNETHFSHIDYLREYLGSDFTDYQVSEQSLEAMRARDVHSLLTETNHIAAEQNNVIAPSPHRNQ